MYHNSAKSAFMVGLSNLPGWRNRRKIVVIESDDWGSVYMKDKQAFDFLKSRGVPVSSHYLSNDTLESVEDMEMLFNVLRKHKDSTGRSVVMTGVNVLANPAFDKIKANNFSKYEYELFPETSQRIGCGNIQKSWQQGIRERIMVPVFHGREHLNVQRWMRLLQQGNETIHLAFDVGVAALSRDLENRELPDLRAAFDIDTLDDLPYQQEVMRTGLDIFEKLFGFRSTFFIPTNGPMHNSLETVAAESGIRYLGTGKIHKEPVGNGAHKKHYRYLGKRNSSGQTYLTRNCFFEPGSWEFPENRNWVNTCLKEIEIAFRSHKPATISSHRVNYMGTINPEYRQNGLNKLDELLGKIIKCWPEVEFLTSMELGDLISGYQK